MEGRAPLLEFI
jgi:hypothetical protein